MSKPPSTCAMLVAPDGSPLRLSPAMPTSPADSFANHSCKRPINSRLSPCAITAAHPTPMSITKAVNRHHHAVHPSITTRKCVPISEPRSQDRSLVSQVITTRHPRSVCYSSRMSPRSICPNRLPLPAQARSASRAITKQNLAAQLRTNSLSATKPSCACADDAFR
jgi:hypothetical protein